MSDARRAALAIAGLALALGSRARPARAQDAPPSSASFALARREFESGVALLEALRFADAAAALEHSLRLRDSPPVRYNLGLALRGSGADRRAIAVLDEFLARPGSASPELQTTARRIVAELTESLVHVTLDTRGGARGVWVDGQRVADGDGVRVLELDPGSHTFEAERPGFRRARRTARFDARDRGEIQLDASAAPIPATLVVETGNSRATIRIDDVLVGSGRIAAQLLGGNHEVTVWAPDVALQHRTIAIPLGARVMLSITARAPSLTERWWFWTGVGALLVGGGVIAGVAIFSRTEPPYPTTLGYAQGLTAR